MKLLMTMVVAAFALAAVAQEAVAERKARPPRQTMTAVDPVLRAALNPKTAEKLELTDDQSAKLKSLADDKAEMKALQEKVRKGMERQAELLRAETIDEAAVLAAVDDVFETRKEIARRQTKRLIAVKSILTPEQIKKASEALETARLAKRSRTDRCSEKAADSEKKANPGKKARKSRKADAESGE